MKHLPRARLLAPFTALLLASSFGYAQVVLTGSSYSQNFDTVSSGLPAGWSVYAGATSTTLGSVATFTTAQTTWGSLGGTFANTASATALNPGSSTAAQNSSSNRALGIRQTGAFGDPGAAFTFHFTSTDITITALDLDLMMLSVQPRSTTWTVDYGIGASPTSFTTLTTWTDPGEFGTTSITLSSGIAGLSNQSDVWLRVAALDASTGSGTRDSIGLDNFELTYTAVPEPSTYALIAGGAAFALAAFRRRKITSPAP